MPARQHAVHRRKIACASSSVMSLRLLNLMKSSRDVITCGRFGDGENGRTLRRKSLRDRLIETLDDGDDSDDRGHADDDSNQRQRGAQFVLTQTGRRQREKLPKPPQF